MGQLGGNGFNKRHGAHSQGRRVISVLPIQTNKPSPAPAEVSTPPETEVTPVREAPTAYQSPPRPVVVNRPEPRVDQQRSIFRSRPTTELTRPDLAKPTGKSGRIVASHAAHQLAKTSARFKQASRRLQPRDSQRLQQARHLLQTGRDHLPDLWQELRSIRWRRLCADWLPPLVLTLLVLTSWHTIAAADAPPSPSELQSYLQDHELAVYSTSEPGEYPQIEYLYQGHFFTVTNTAYANLHPVSSGPWVTWQGVIDGQGQVFLYNVLTQVTTQLTNDGSNEGVAVYQGTVAWQHWDGQNWQIYYYNGSGITQITNNNDSSIGAQTDGQQVIYAEEIGPDDWKVQSYNVHTGQIQTVSEGNTVDNSYPHFNEDGSIGTSLVPQ